MRFVALALVCACAVASLADKFPGAEPARTQDYTELLDVVERNGQALLENLPREPLMITDHRRHYVTIIGVLGYLAEYLNSECSPPSYYNAYLPAVDRFVPLIWKNPGPTVEKLEQILKDIKKGVQPIRDLVDTYCTDLSSKVCNQIIEVIMFFRTDLRKTVNLLTAAAKLGSTYEENRYIEEAKNYDEVSLLINGKNNFYDIVQKMVVVLNKLYGKQCFSKKR